MNILSLTWDLVLLIVRIVLIGGVTAIWLLLLISCYYGVKEDWNGDDGTRD